MMTTVDNNGTSRAVLDQYRSENNTSAPKKSNELGQDEFLKLMIAELNNQNPLDPQENGEFIAQLAQFSQVESLEKLNQSTDSVVASMRSSQALQASSLVGRSVIVDGNDTGLLLQGGIISGYTDLPETATDIKLRIEDENGQLLEQIPLGNHGAGELSVRWDGLNLLKDGQVVDLDYKALNRQEFYRDENGEFVLDENGNKIQAPYPPGEYRFKLTGNVGGKSEQFDTLMSARVESVSLGQGGATTLNLAGGQRSTMDEVKQIVNE